MAPRGGDPSGLPDLTVSRIEVVSGEVRFRVSNRGPGVKKPGRVNYFLAIDYFDLSGRQTGTKTFVVAFGMQHGGTSLTCMASNGGCFPAR